jgi:hypothetical protein
MQGPSLLQNDSLELENTRAKQIQTKALFCKAASMRPKRRYLTKTVSLNQ